MQPMDPERAAELIGVTSEGNLNPCPNMPNCICSCYENERKHFLPPIKIPQDSTPIFQKIKELMLQSDGVDLVKSSSEYLHFTVTSSLIKFVDDVEFLVKGDYLHFRSASRVGYWDLGANRKRIRQLLAKAIQSSSN